MIIPLRTIEYRVVATRYLHETSLLEADIRNAAYKHNIVVQRLYWQESWFSITFRFKVEGSEPELRKFGTELREINHFRQIQEIWGQKCE